MSLGTRLASLDAARFVGRSAELGRLRPLLGADRPASVVLLHGPGGVGKSALLREFARQVLTRGYLDPAPTHELAAAELSLSRTSYFRHLRVAVGRVAIELGVRPSGTNAELSRRERRRPGRRRSAVTDRNRSGRRRRRRWPWYLDEDRCHRQLRQQACSPRGPLAVSTSSSTS